MSVGSKTKSYLIQSGNLLLFIFLYQPPELALAGANPLLRPLFQTLNIGAPMLDLWIGVIGDVTSCRNAEAFGLIVIVLESVFCFWYCFHLSVL